MKIQLSEHFTYKKLLRFVLPSIIMMIFTSIYSVVDGLFVSNFVGKTALAAINLTLPIIMGLSALGFMIGTGGSAIVARMLGEKKIFFHAHLCDGNRRYPFIHSWNNFHPGNCFLARGKRPASF